MGGVADFVGDVVSGVGDVVEGAGDLVGDAVEFVGDSVADTVDGVVNTAEAFIEDPIEFTEAVINNALENPVETAAIVAAAYFAPELVMELAPELSAEVASVATKALTGATKSAITGGDILEGALSGVVSGITDQGIKSLGDFNIGDYVPDELLTDTDMPLELSGDYDLPDFSELEADAPIELSDFDVSEGIESIPLEEPPVEDFTVAEGSGLTSLPVEEQTTTQVYDDGSELTYNVETGLPISGIDTEGAEFSVSDGIGAYVGTGEQLGGEPETTFGGQLADPTDVQKLLDYNASLNAPTTPVKVGGGSSSSGMSPSQLAALTGIGALAAKGIDMPNVPRLGYQGPPLEYTAERLPGMGVKYTPKMAAQGGLMNLMDPSNAVQMYQAGGKTEADAALEGMMKAGAGQSVGIANQLNYLMGRGLSADQAKQILQQGVNVYSFARGGISDLGSYTHATGGRMLKGPGDGMSDSIPASIEGKRPAKLATDEFVVPADVVSHLGNGSSDAGAKVLYEMMDKVRKARTGTKKQGKQINPGKYLPK